MTAECWDLTDAWIFTAVGEGTRHDDLSALVGAADHYAHDVPSEADLSRSVGRLLASGLLTETARAWQPTAAGRALWEGSTGAGYGRVVSVHEQLVSVPLVEGRREIAPGALDRAHHRHAHPFTWRLPRRRPRYSTRGRH
ncbi:hypothetical protein [Cellulomonas sp. IC4_254]|uniref:hypothetical protein n=1 Tax=Cellulomonas sp. IC4_254 TaxID=2714040 RepID=UPI0014236955|nr:hypothetical protein [Cellulomonas sp. IC4_254]NHT19431.1 hypothetical protein [Cellulomonas sp. IC4_254]